MADRRSGDDGRGPGAAPVQQALFEVEQRYHEGPLPAPETLAEYGAISPDLVERIVAMAETQVHGRHQVLSRAMRAENFATMVGAATIAIVAAGGMGLTFVMLSQGQPPSVALLTSLPAVLVGLGRAFATLRSAGKDE